MASPILGYFDSEHLSEPARAVAEAYGRFARSIDESLPSGPETTVALRKLLESMDAALRAARGLPSPPPLENGPATANPAD